MRSGARRRQPGSGSRTTRRQTGEYRAHSAAPVDARADKQAHLVEQSCGEKTGVDMTAADRHPLDSELICEQLAGACKVDSVMSAGDIAYAALGEVIEVVASDLLARYYEQRVLSAFVAVPEQGTVRVDYCLISVRAARDRKHLVSYRFSAARELARLSHLELRGHSAAHAGRRAERIEGIVIVLYARQVLGHGAVYAPSTEGIMRHIVYGLFISGSPLQWIILSVRRCA